MKDTAIIILACMDFESLEVALANYLEMTNKDVHFYILQNGRGTYDKERTYRVAQRYRDLYPARVTVVDWIPETKPYAAIKTLINSDEMSQYKYICKVDDDTYPVTKDWIEKLKQSYIDKKPKFGDKLGFTFPLVNNNPSGFKRTVELMGLNDEYVNNIARKHLAGLACAGEHFPLRILEKEEISQNGFGTIWRYAYIAKWIHEKTTFDVDNWVEKLKTCKDEIFDNKIRYSINCMFFEKDYWNTLDDGSNDDEAAVHLNAMRNNQQNILVTSVPFVHLFFFVQREENRELIPRIRSYCQARLNLNYPIAICESKEYENENRLRYIENSLLNNLEQKLDFLQKEYMKCKYISILGIKFKIKIAK